MSQNINLFNPALQQRRDALSARNVAAAAGAALVLVFAAYGYVRYATAELEGRARRDEVQVKQEQAALAALTKRLADSKPDAQLVAQLSQAEAVLKGRQELEQVLASGAVGKAEGFSEHFRAFSRQTTHGVWLTGFAIGAGGGEMEIHGSALSPELLPAYIRRLNGEKVFQGRGFAALSVKGVQDTPPAAKLEAAKAAAQQSAGAAALPPALPPHIEFSLSSGEQGARGQP